MGPQINAGQLLVKLTDLTAGIESERELPVGSYARRAIRAKLDLPGR
jgi:hypothetical protein